jgi:hypothetical protein
MSSCSNMTKTNSVIVHIIDSKRNLLLDVLECTRAPKVGETLKISSGLLLTLHKVRNNINKNVVEGYVEMPLKHKTWPNNKRPYDK